MTTEKSLILDVSGWLRLFDDGSVDRTWTGPPEVKFVAESVPPHEEFIDGVAVRDVVIDQKSGLRVRTYLPEVKCAGGKKLPVVVHFHGGGFCISEADWFMYYHTYTGLVRSAEAICVSVYLRRAPEHRLPAAIEDGLSALRWLRSVALGNEIEPWIVDNADFKRVFLIGDSSGGNLVHSVAALAGDADLAPLKLAGGIPIHPGFVRAKRSKSEMENPQSPFLTLDMVDKFLSLALPAGSSKDHPITCPMGTDAPPLESLDLPPFLLCIAEKDLVIDTEMEYYEAMKAANKEVEILMSKGMGHSFYLNKIALKIDPETAAESDRLFAGIARFIKQH